MNRLLLVVALVVAPAVAAQEPPDSGRAEELRAEIERRFAERVRGELGLSDDQATRLRATQETFGERRRALMRRQFERRRALQEQMRPGVAANPDSVKRLLDGINEGRAEMLKLEQEEDREMTGYLSPVQRAQFQMMRQRFLQRVEQLRERRGMRPGMGRPRPEGRRPPRKRAPA